MESYLLFSIIIRRALLKKFPNSQLPTIDELENKITTCLKETITFARFNYDDCLEEELYQAALLMNLGEYRNFQIVKSEVKERHKFLESLTDINDLRTYGQGKEAFSSIMRWLNDDLKFNISKAEITQEISREDTLPDLLLLLQALVSKESRRNPEQLQPMIENHEQDDIEIKVEQLLLNFGK